MENTESKPLLKIVVAELTEGEHKALMNLLVMNLTHNQSALTELRFMPIPECSCGKCEKDELAKGHKDMLEALERGVATLQSITEKLK